MIHSVVAIHNGTEFIEYCPYIFTGPNTGLNGSGWSPVGAYVYDSSAGYWSPIGGVQTLMVPFYVGGASGNYFITSDGKTFQVPANVRAYR